jgi:CheY-like chemotaxis protein
VSLILAPSNAPAESGPPVERGTSDSFFSLAPELLACARKTFELVRHAPDNPLRQQNLGSIQLRLQTLAASAKAAQLPVATRVTTAVEFLLKRLHQNAKTVTPSTMLTVSNALVVLEKVCQAGVEERLRGQCPVRILVVEDEPLARRAVLGALQPSFENTESADQGSVALFMASQTAYDVIFTDVEMPAMNGFELCNHIRSAGLNQNTPVIFVTNYSGSAARSRAERSGGADFIAKPFLPIEVTVKAHTFIWEGRLKQRLAGSVG